jgi:ATP synthase protein I
MHKSVPPDSSDALPPLRYALAARAESEAQSSGAWSLRHLRMCWAALAVTAALIATVGFLTAGGRAGVGALVGSGIVGIFFSVSAVVIARVGARHPARVMWAALGAYVVKMIALGIVLVLIPRDGAIDTRWMAGAVGLGLAVWLAAHMRFVWTNKIFYVGPN